MDTAHVEAIHNRSGQGLDDAAVVVLDRTATFVTCAVREVRGKGAFNASANELAKKIAILRGLKTD